jgi:hypothetical protein
MMVWMLTKASIGCMVKSMANTAVKAAPSGRWTLRDKAPRSTPYQKR